MKEDLSKMEVEVVLKVGGTIVGTTKAAPLDARKVAVLENRAALGILRSAMVGAGARMIADVPAVITAAKDRVSRLEEEAKALEGIGDDPVIITD